MKDFSQLWKEEKELLAEYAANVPQGGTIVEIGTAQGGSASIFYQACKHKSVKIYSYDIAPSEEAYINLSDTSVKIISEPSIAGALDWKKDGRESIDLLFIDGSHAFEDVYKDFVYWMPLLKSGSRIIFHDYDPPERGGIAHLAVRIFIDTLIKCDILNNCSHQHKLFSGTLKGPLEALRLNGFAATMRGIIENVNTILKKELVGWRICGDDKLSKILQSCLELDIDSYVESCQSNNTKSDGMAYICSSEASGIDGHTGNVIPITQLDACYILNAGLKKNRDGLLSLTKDRAAFFEWEEILQMFVHAFGDKLWDDKWLKMDFNALSKIIAQEQVRLKIISNILRSVLN